MEIVREITNVLKLYIKYMVSTRCKMVVNEELKKLGLHFILVDLGVVDIMENITIEQHDQIKAALFKSGLELMDDKRAVLIERIRNIIIEMVHYSEELPKTNFSEPSISVNSAVKALVSPCIIFLYMRSIYTAPKMMVKPATADNQILYW